jgi:diguanylate cyclase (GGDEF)-like protein
MATDKQTILIVDDLPENIRLLNLILGPAYQIFFATRGQEGLEVAMTQRPDLILLDVMLPDIDGFEVCTRLKADPLTRPLPVIFITALNKEAHEERGLEVGAIDYITKPFSPLIVRARVRNHLQLKRYQDILENLSTTDGLTGIPNRRQFDAFLEREWRRAIRNQTPLALIMMDIDNFKAYNDDYGHLAGDDCLRQIAQALAAGARRPADLVARYGGEEFASVLPDTEAAGAVCVASQLQANVTALKIPHARLAPTEHVTMSMGVAALEPGPGQASIDLIRQADARLYAAKQHGRNQIRS